MTNTKKVDNTVASQTDNVATTAIDFNDPQAVIKANPDAFQESEKYVLRKDDGLLIEKSKCTTKENGGKTVYITKDVTPAKIQLGESNVKMGKWNKKTEENEDNAPIVEGQKVTQWYESKIIYVKNNKVMEGTIRRLVPEKPTKAELVPAEGHLMFQKTVTNEGADLGEGPTKRIIYGVFEPFKKAKHNHVVEIDGKAWGQIGSTGQGRHEEAYELIKNHPLFGTEIGLYPKSRISLTRGVILIDEARLTTQPMKNGPANFSEIPGFKAEDCTVVHSKETDKVGTVVVGTLWNPQHEYDTAMAERKAKIEAEKAQKEGENKTDKVEDTTATPAK